MTCYCHTDDSRQVTLKFFDDARNEVTGVSLNRRHGRVVWTNPNCPDYNFWASCTDGIVTVGNGQPGIDGMTLRAFGPKPVPSGRLGAYTVIMQDPRVVKSFKEAERFARYEETAS